MVTSVMYTIGFCDGRLGRLINVTEHDAKEYVVGYFDGLKAAVTAKIAVTKAMSRKCPYRRGHKTSRWNRGIVT